ncbi:MAG: hypothetical protein PHQ74_05775 [Crocinitomicaceae bacterium]|nr:hypothetical protein [Crocinitomicaceae bacterium]
MQTITLKINPKNKTAKALKELIDAISSKPNSGIEIIEEDSPYDPEFVKKIKRAEAEKGGKTMTSAAELWESIK